MHSNLKCGKQNKHKAARLSNFKFNKQFKGMKKINDFTHSKRQAEIFHQNKNCKGAFGRSYTFLIPIVFFFR